MPADPDLSDLEFGRLWAKQMGRRPNETDGEWEWWGIQTQIAPDAVLPPPVWACVGAPGAFARYETPSEAYAALGRAVRSVHAAVPPLRDPEAAPDAR